MKRTGKQKLIRFSETITTTFQKLTSREKYSLILCTVFIACFAVLQMMIIPYLQVHGQLEKSIIKKQRDLAHIHLLSRQYIKLHNENGSIKNRLQSRQSSFSLFTFLDEQAEKINIKNNIKYMQPSENSDGEGFDESLVEMKLANISLTSLVEYLTLIESDVALVFIKRLSIQKSTDMPGYLDVVLQLITFKKNT